MGIVILVIGLGATAWGIFLLVKYIKQRKAFNAQEKVASTREQAHAAILKKRQDISRKSKKLRKLLTGQLVARFYQNQDPTCKLEYTSRLEYLGIPTDAALRLFDYELSLMTPGKAALLADDAYLKSFYFDLKSPLLPEPKDYYVAEQPFLCSEITKIWDEAEWHYWNSHEQSLPESVWTEIYTLSRYGGGELLVEYLAEMAERAQVSIGDLQRYSKAEQDMIFRYKWNPGEIAPHPYGT